MSQPSSQDPPTDAFQLPIVKGEGDTVPDSYIVVLQANTLIDTHYAWMDEEIEKYSHTRNRCEITHKYHIIKGYSAFLSGEALRAVRNRQGVLKIVEDSHVRLPCVNKGNAEPPFDLPSLKMCQEESSATGPDWEATITRVGTTWGLQRISSKPQIPPTPDPCSLNYSYSYASIEKVTKVRVYVLDTGVNINHTEFGDRASHGDCFVAGEKPDDGNGHGTHVAGTIAGNHLGVYNRAEIISVKVLPNDGPGIMSDVIAGIDYATTEAQKAGPSVGSIINMSLGCGANDLMDEITIAAVSKGVHVCVAAGEEEDGGRDAKEISPARASGVLTAAAMTVEDEAWPKSNHGSMVDIYAPGEKVLSAWIGSRTMFRCLGGTSMASPHVAGLVAYLISLNGNIPPAQMVDRVRGLGLPCVKNVPKGTRNLLLQNKASV